MTKKSIAAQQREINRQSLKLAKARERQAVREAKARERAEVRLAALRKKQARAVVSLCRAHARELDDLCKKYGITPHPATITARCALPEGVTHDERDERLEDMSISELRSLYQSLYGAPTRRGRSSIIEKLTTDHRVSISSEIARWRRSR